MVDPINQIVNRGQSYGVALDGPAVFQDASSCKVMRYAGCMPILDLNDRAVLGYGNGVAGLDDDADRFRQCQ